MSELQRRVLASVEEAIVRADRERPSLRIDPGYRVRMVGWTVVHVELDGPVFAAIDVTKGFPFTGDMKDHEDGILGYKDGNEY